MDDLFIKDQDEHRGRKGKMIVETFQINMSGSKEWLGIKHRAD
jgi:hypothetical protein